MLTKTMKAAVASTYGGPDVVSLRDDVAVPTIRSPTEVLVKMRCTSINPIDYKMLEGRLSLLEGRQMQRVRGFDLCGEVVAVGSAVSKFKVGDIVVGAKYFREVCAGHGTWAEYTCVDAQYLTRKSDKATDAEAAGMPIAAMTSYHALTTAYSNLKAGEKVLIIGASGGTGTFAVQLAANLIKASTVTAVCSGKNAELVRALGATDVIDYTTTKWWEALAGKDYDVVYDCVGQPDIWPNSHKVLK
eukprot:PhM_4_TR18654/c2_g1_i4/m.75769